ncbi:GGDEF domain-containing protein [Paenibacillus sp. S150]|uniref:GGDEF domain-containing protein n=1 Tax=Paenibacillus sp. S150 TaxID=2749826 RepID=UPI001C59C2E3|nr:GGDEF domain-containing protein [Paenibacillus sp. S150]MBW4084727.1 GGDEF domain-containing protein [Paenibacillus sp. S150]
MAFQLDIRTLVYLFIFGNLFTALLISYYRLHFPRDTASTLFIAAKWLQVVYWSSILLWAAVPHYIAIPLSNFLILAGGGLEIAALLLMMGLLGRKAKLYYWTITICSVISFCIVVLFFNSPNMRVATTSLWVIMFVIYPAYRLTANRAGSPLQRLMGFIFYAFAAAMLIRSMAALLLESDMGALTPNMPQYLYFMGMFFLLVVGTAAFILLSNEHTYEKLKRIATYDGLTGILGRRTFMLEAELKLALAVKKRDFFSLLLLDLDHFKSVNDTHGHEAGDTVLQDFVLVLQNHLGSSDLFGRVGGEEFAVMLYGLDEEESGHKAERLRAAVKEEAADFTNPGGYTVSIGIVTVLPDSLTSLNMLYKLSDRALYQAKQQGRNRVVRSR